MQRVSLRYARGTVHAEAAVERLGQRQQSDILRAAAQLQLCVGKFFLKTAEDLRQPLCGNTGKGADAQPLFLCAGKLGDMAAKLCIRRKQSVDKGSLHKMQEECYGRHTKKKAKRF